MLSVARTSTTTLPSACGHAGDCARIDPLLRKSIRPKIAARNPKITPTLTSHAEKFAHIIWADHQYVRSVRRTPRKQAIGIGASIGWMGCRKIRDVARGFVTDKD